MTSLVLQIAQQVYVFWISVPGPKHTFLLVAQLLESSKILVKPKERKAGGGEGRQKCSS